MKAIKTTDLKELREQKSKEREEIVVAYAAIADLNEQVLLMQEELNTLKGGENNG